jgi:hypothetical protein
VLAAALRDAIPVREAELCFPEFCPSTPNLSDEVYISLVISLLI